MSNLYPIKRRAQESYTSEFDILKASHKFLRREDEDVTKSWDAQLAKKYEDSLFKEFAICDLKHYKSGNIALRWRTEDEVLSGAGETSCGNTRCPHHDAPREPSSRDSLNVRPHPPQPPKLTTMELPFSYVEQGETDPREVMVKVVLCERCVKKLTWKREKEKRDRVDTRLGDTEQGDHSERGVTRLVEDERDRDKDQLEGRSRQDRRIRYPDRSRSKSPRRSLGRNEPSHRGR